MHSSTGLEKLCFSPSTVTVRSEAVKPPLRWTIRHVGVSEREIDCAFIVGRERERALCHTILPVCHGLP